MTVTRTVFSVSSGANTTAEATSGVKSSGAVADKRPASPEARVDTYTVSVEVRSPDRTIFSVSATVPGDVHAASHSVTTNGELEFVNALSKPTVELDADDHAEESSRSALKRTLCDLVPRIVSFTIHERDGKETHLEALWSSKHPNASATMAGFMFGGERMRSCIRS